MSAQVKQAEFQKNDKVVVTKADAPKAMGNDKKSKADLFAKRKLQEKLAFGWIEKQDDGSGQRIMILQHMFDAAEFRGQAAVVRFPYVTTAGAQYTVVLHWAVAAPIRPNRQTVLQTAMLWLHRCKHEPDTDRLPLLRCAVRTASSLLAEAAQSCSVRSFVQLEEFTADIQTECAKFGELEKVTVFDQNPAGVVAVKFRKTECAEDCIQVRTCTPPRGSDQCTPVCADS